MSLRNGGVVVGGVTAAGYVSRAAVFDSGNSYAWGSRSVVERAPLLRVAGTPADIGPYPGGRAG
ncbi:hypothetical protein SAMN05660662_3677 [Blastococcus aurantiacus]|uniref:Uncharacterized protein n=1 Tax=Blastococcus aurantiacus TaxID=1550231 RepID=A0A1G7PQF9_9ACTN|nr:hypothetical protein SAMN05660662_3677 [Blastococcus aurantiacus]